MEKMTKPEKILAVATAMFGEQRVSVKGESVNVWGLDETDVGWDVFDPYIDCEMNQSVQWFFRVSMSFLVNGRLAHASISWAEDVVIASDSNLNAAIVDCAYKAIQAGWSNPDADAD